MVVCRLCNGNFDNGELIGGICQECREEEKQRQLRVSNVAEMMHGPSEQMELNLEEMISE